MENRTGFTEAHMTGWYIILAFQFVTFIVLGALLIARGELRLGIAQLLLAVVQAVIYAP